MTRYSYDITLEESSTSFTKLIQVGNRALTFAFQWAVVSEEQYALIERYLTTKAQSDPLFENGEFNRSYDWFSYYYSLKDTDLDTWLDSGPVLPASLHNKSREQQLYLLNIYITEAKSLEPAISLYKDVLKWEFTMTCDDLDTAVGYVQPGGWYHHQDNSLSFCFVSALDNIGKDDITKVSIMFEVYDE